VPDHVDPEIRRRAAIESAARLDPELRHRRAIIAGRSRTGPDYHLRKLTEQLASLTGAQRHRLAELALAASGGDGDG
jgi:hypothetical protein